MSIKKYDSILTREFLEEEYLKQDKTLKQIANKFCIAQSIITRYAKKLCVIKIRNTEKLLTKEFFEEQYYKFKKSKTQIANEFNISRSSVDKYFKRFNLIRRTQSEQLKGRIFSEEHKRKIGEAHRGERGSNYIDGRSIKEYFCLDCGRKIHYKNKRCSACWYKFNTGKNNSFYGKTHSDESNKKRFQSLKLRKEKGLHNSTYKGGLPHCVDCHKELSAYHCVRCRSCDYKYRVGEKHPRFGKVALHPSMVKYNHYLFRSSWEANFAKWCDNSGIKWEYEITVFKLDKNKSYIPDFYLPEFNCWIEIKGWLREDAKNKLLFFYKTYPEINIFIWSKKELIDKSIINYRGLYGTTKNTISSKNKKRRQNT